DARHDGHTRLDSKLPGRGLVAKTLEQIRAGSDESDAGLVAGPRQFRILREEAVAGMDRVDHLLLRQGDNAGDIEVGLDWPLALTDLVGLVGLETVEAERVFPGVDGDRAESQFRGRPPDAD